VALEGGLTITEGHPIRVGGEWVKPGEVRGGGRVDGGCVYNFILSTNHILLVNGIECITWGHNLTEAGVAHAYYGTDAIVNDLKQMPGWKAGFV